MSEAVKAKSSNNIFKIIIVILFVAILVGGAAFGGYFIASKSKPAQVTNTIVTTAGVTKLADQAYYDMGDEFLVNLADADSKRYLKAKITLAYNIKNKKMAEELESNKNALRDSIISVISAKKAEELTSKGREDLKKEIMDRLNPLLTEGQILNVYYSDIIVQ